MMTVNTEVKNCEQCTDYTYRADKQLIFFAENKNLGSLA